MGPKLPIIRRARKTSPERPKALFRGVPILNMASNQAAPSSHLPALDGLRGFAALWVLVGHVFQQTALGSPILWLPLHNGYAVDLFMMLSGYLMFRLYGASADSKPAAFWLRRWFRLTPLYFTCLLLAFLTASSFLVARKAIFEFSQFNFATWPIRSDWPSALAHVTFAFGLIPSLSQSTAMPDWSLSLEMQFYLLFPALVALFKRVGAGLATVVLAATQLLLLLLFQSYFREFTFPSPLPLELNLFLSGMAIAIPGRRQILVGVLLATMTSSSPSAAAVRAVLALLLATGARAAFHPVLLPLASLVRRPFEVPLARWLGSISYPIYLTHLTVLFFALSALLNLGLHEKRLLAAITLAITLAVTLSISQLLHWLIELPGINFGRRAVARVSGRMRESGPGLSR